MKKAFWLGESIDSLPQLMQLEINENYDVKSSWDDIASILEPAYDIVFFYYSNDLDWHCHQARDICRTIKKQFIVVVGAFEQLPPTVNNSLVLRSDVSVSELARLITPEQFKTSRSRFDRGEVKELIHTSISAKINETDMAKKFNFSTPHFSKMFKKEFGVNFQDYIATARIDKAKAMLMHEHDTRIANVSYFVGYDDVSYFSRVFKKHTGMTPTQFRAHTKEDQLKRA